MDDYFAKSKLIKERGAFTRDDVFNLLFDYCDTKETNTVVYGNYPIGEWFKRQKERMMINCIPNKYVKINVDNYLKKHVKK